MSKKQYTFKWAIFRKILIVYFIFVENSFRQIQVILICIHNIFSQTNTFWCARKLNHVPF
jgi:hypothetical protein